MSLFSQQPVFCPNCGKAHAAELTGERRESFLFRLCCTKACFDEMRLKITRSIMGKPPATDPKHA